MKIIKMFLLIFIFLSIISACSININTPDKYDTLNMYVSENARDKIENINNMNMDVIYTGADAKILLDIVTELSITSKEPTYNKNIVASSVTEELNRLNLPSSLLISAKNGMSGYYYSNDLNEYRAYFVEEVETTKMGTGSIGIYLQIN